MRLFLWKMDMKTEQYRSFNSIVVYHTFLRILNLNIFRNVISIVILLRNLTLIYIWN